MPSLGITEETHSVVIAGIWKFAHEFVDNESKLGGYEALEALANKWKSADGKNYDYLQVRRCGPDQVGIEFRYRLPPERTRKQFIHNMSDYLRRRFGNDLVAWDIGETSVIK